jgi:hypothetical protein
MRKKFDLAPYLHGLTGHQDCNASIYARITNLTWWPRPQPGSPHIWLMSRLYIIASARIYLFIPLFCYHYTASDASQTFVTFSVIIRAAGDNDCKKELSLRSREFSRKISKMLQLPDPTGTGRLPLFRPLLPPLFCYHGYGSASSENNSRKSRKLPRRKFIPIIRRITRRLGSSNEANSC